MSKVLITGGAGFIGFSVARRLVSEGHDVIILDNKKDGKNELNWMMAEQYGIKKIYGSINYLPLWGDLDGDIDAIIHCVLPHTTIVINNIPMSISDLQIKRDMALTHKRRFKHIKHKIKRFIKEEIFEITPMYANIPLEITGEHPIKIWRPSKRCPYFNMKCSPACGAKRRGRCPEHYKKDKLEWMAVKNIKKGDFVVYPRLKEIKGIKYNNPPFFRLIGYYLAEGCLGNQYKEKYYSIRFSFNENEQNYIEDAQKLLETYFNKAGSIEYKGGEATITVSSVEAATFFSQFGHGAENKKIPHNFMIAPNKHIEQLLVGYYRGDGCQLNGKASTVSRDLAYQIRMLYHRLGVLVGIYKRPPRVGKIDGRKIQGKLPQYEIAISRGCQKTPFMWNKSRTGETKSYAWFDENYVYVPIRKIQTRIYRGFVFNLEISEDETYCAEGILVHNCAAQTAVTKSLEDPLHDFITNAEGTFNVCEFARKHDAKIIFTSTNKVYGDNVNKISLKEEKTRYRYAGERYCVDELFPIDRTAHSPYGMSKLCADLCVQEYHHTYGLDTVVFRQSCIFGSDQIGSEGQGWIAHIVHQWVNGGRINIFGNGKQVRDVLHIDDLVPLFLQIVERGISGVFNIGGGLKNTISVLELIDMLDEWEPHDRNMLFWYPWRPADQKVYISNVNKAKRILGFAPTISPKKGIGRLFNRKTLMRDSVKI